jgi:hypothetical protein
MPVIQPKQPERFAADRLGQERKPAQNTMTTNSVSLTDAQQTALQELRTVADKIRYLDQEGLSRADIARTLDKRYQHVRNVLVRTETAIEGHTKTTFTVSFAAISALDRSLKEFGLGRNTYLSSVLPECLNSLKRASANSQQAEDLLHSYYRSDTEEQVRRGTLFRLSLTLNQRLVEDMNTACANKRIPRDLFMEGVLEAGNRALSKALELFSSPVDYAESIGEPLCREYLLSDADAEALEHAMEEESLVIQAITQIKNIGYEQARESYAALPPDQRSRIRDHNEVRSVMAQLRSTLTTPVTLDDLLVEGA